MNKIRAIIITSYLYLCQKHMPDMKNKIENQSQNNCKSLYLQSGLT